MISPDSLTRDRVHLNEDDDVRVGNPILLWIKKKCQECDQFPFPFNGEDLKCGYINFDVLAVVKTENRIYECEDWRLDG